MRGVIFSVLFGGFHVLRCRSYGEVVDSKAHLPQGIEVIVDHEVLIFMPSGNMDKDVQLSHAGVFCRDHNIMSVNCPALLVASAASDGPNDSPDTTTTETYLDMFRATGDLNAAGLAGWALCSTGNYEASDPLLRAASASEDAFVEWKASLNLAICLTRRGRFVEALPLARRASFLAHSAPEISKRDPKAALWDSDFTLIICLMWSHGPKVARKEASRLLSQYPNKVPALWPFQLWFAVLDANSEVGIRRARDQIKQSVDVHGPGQVSTAMHKAGVCVPLDRMLDDKELLTKMLYTATLDPDDPTNDQPFYPASFVLPHEIGQFRTWVKKSGKRDSVLIAKPVHASDGQGIFLAKSSEVLAQHNMQETSSLSAQHKHEPKPSKWNQGTILLQEYISNPQTIRGYKFDLRVFVSVLSLVPLRVYVHEEGYAKFAPKRYNTSQGITDEYLSAHITNSHSPYRNMEDTCALPRTMTQILKILYPDHAMREQVWHRIQSVAQKTIGIAVPMAIETSCSSRDSLSGQSDSQNRFFCAPGKTYGFDFLLDTDGGVWLLEINSQPGPFYGGLKCDGDPPADLHFLQRWTDLVVGVALPEIV